MNCGVILRERPQGKKMWSAIKIKLELADELAYLGQGDRNETVSSDADSSELVSSASPDRLRLRRDIMHIPGFAGKRTDCRVHMQRKATSFHCLTCKKAICSSLCWSRYHKKRICLMTQIANQKL